MVNVNASGFYKMTAKADQWIWYVDTRYKRIRKIKLKSFIHKVNEDPYYHRSSRKYFETKELARLHLAK